MGRKKRACRRFDTEEERITARQATRRRYRERNLDRDRVYNKARHAVRYVENKRVVWQLKADRGCRYCGINDPICLEFHHRDPSEKRCGVGELMGNLPALLREAEKCDVVCANCHCYTYRKGLDGELHLPPYLKTD